MKKYETFTDIDGRKGERGSYVRHYMDFLQEEKPLKVIDIEKTGRQTRVFLEDGDDFIGASVRIVKGAVKK